MRVSLEISGRKFSPMCIANMRDPCACLIANRAGNSVPCASRICGGGHPSPPVGFPPILQDEPFGLYAWRAWLCYNEGVAKAAGVRAEKELHRGQASCIP